MNRFNDLKQKHNAQVNLINLHTINAANGTCFTLEDVSSQTVAAIDCKSSLAIPLTTEEKITLLQKDAREAGGLEGVLKLCMGDLVTIRTNLLPKVGLVTNARGMVVGFGRNKETKTIEIVFVKVTDLRNTNVSFGNGNYGEKVVPIPRTTVNFSFRGYVIYRKMFPLNLCVYYSLGPVHDV